MKYSPGFCLGIVLATTVNGFADCAYFLPGNTYFVGDFGVSLALIRDLDSDGKNDLALESSFLNRVSISLGNGDGSFQAMVHYPVGVNPQGLAAADLNNDSRLDLVTANKNSGNVSVLIGNGNGSFQSAVNYAVTNQPVRVAIGDINNDLNLDLVVCNTMNTYRLFGNGDGSFQAAIFVTLGAGNTLDLKDMNGDGNLDLIESGGVKLGNGDGRFYQLWIVWGFNPGYQVIVTDFNADSILDMVGASGTVEVILGAGNGTPLTTHSICNNVGDYCAVGEINGDGHLDLIYAHSNSGTVSLALGIGDGNFHPGINVVSGVSFTNTVEVGLLNGDSRPDVLMFDSVTQSPTIPILLNAGYSISGQPENQQVVTGQNAVFSVSVGGISPLTYQWRRNGIPLSDGGSYSGASTAALNISNATSKEIGAYDVIVSFSCFKESSYPAALNVSPICRGDFNNDGQYNGLDIPDLVQAMLAGQSCP